MILNNKKIVSYTPPVAIMCLEWANLSQLIRMWTEQTAEGQSLVGWLSVWAALLLWLNFYRVCLPENKLAYWGTVVGLATNTAVWLSVIWFRYL